MLSAPPAGAESIKAVVRQGDTTQAVQLRREGGEILLPLLACGPLLGADATWEPATNRWWIRSRTVTAEGFLDEPLLVLGGRALLVRQPPRLIGGMPFLSLEAVRLLGRRGWDTDLAWDDGKRELSVRSALVQPEAPADSARTRALKAPAVPPGARVIALDPGHARRGGAAGMHGLMEGEVGLALAQAVAATTTAEGVAMVILQDGTEATEPFEVASLANSLKARAFVSFHGSEWGEPGVAVWVWGLSGMGGFGIAFEPFEPPGGWTDASQAHSEKSMILARRVAAAVKEAGIPVHGPAPAPLAALEGISCPAVAVEFTGLGTAEGSRIAADGEIRARVAEALSRTLVDEGAEAAPRP